MNRQNGFVIEIKNEVLVNKIVASLSGRGGGGSGLSAFMFSEGFHCMEGLREYCVLINTVVLPWFTYFSEGFHSTEGLLL